MRILVTGGAGFIGSNTVDALLAKGHEVRILDILQPRVHPRGKPAYIPAEVEFIQGDVTRREDWEKALPGVDAVFHLAAYQDYMPDFSTFLHTNTTSTALLYELIVEKRYPVRKVVLASSQSVYGEGKYRCPEHGVQHPGPRSLAQLQSGKWELVCPICSQEMEPMLIDEAAVNPHTAYGISKYALELVAFNLGRRYDIPSVAMRYSIVQGPRNSFYNAYSGICRIFTMRMLNGLAPVAYEDGQQLRDYVNIRDVVAANVLALERDEANFQAFNVGGGRAVTVLEFARILSGEFENPLPCQVPGEFRLGDTRHTISAIDRLQSLGWTPGTPVETTVKEYVAWVRSQAHSADYLAQSEKIMRENQVVQSIKRA